MIDHKNILRFLSKPEIKLSIEEYLFLITCRFENEEELRDDFKELRAYAELYYAQNVFYGQDFFDEKAVKRINWNLLIKKLILQGYLVDYRTEEDIKNIKNVSWKKLRVTESFKNKIWSTDKNGEWNEIVDLITERCGKRLEFPNGKSQDYFAISSADFVSNLEQLKEYWWFEITNSGAFPDIEKFRHHLEHYIDTNDGLNMKFVTFISNYTKGIFKTRIEKELADEYNNIQKNDSKYKRR
jgi:hypothetical protein